MAISNNHLYLLVIFYIKHKKLITLYIVFIYKKLDKATGILTEKMNGKGVLVDLKYIKTGLCIVQM